MIPASQALPQRTLFQSQPDTRDVALELSQPVLNILFASSLLQAPSAVRGQLALLAQQRISLDVELQKIGFEPLQVTACAGQRALAKREMPQRLHEVIKEWPQAAAVTCIRIARTLRTRAPRGGTSAP